MGNLTSEFIKVRCDGCKNEQVINAKASTTVKCLVCGEILATPRGGKADVTARVLEVLN